MLYILASGWNWKCKSESAFCIIDSKWRPSHHLFKSPHFVKRLLIDLFWSFNWSRNKNRKKVVRKFRKEIARNGSNFSPKNNSQREIKLWQYIRRRAINCPNSVVISAQVRLSPHKAAVKPVLSKTRNFLQRILSFFSNKEKQMKNRLSINKLRFSAYAHIFSISA